MGKTTSGRAGRFITDIDSCFLANNDEGAEITVGPELGALTLSNFSYKFTPVSEIYVLRIRGNFQQSEES